MQEPYYEKNSKTPLHDERRSLIQQHQDSGLSANQFCLQHKLDHKYFCKRKREMATHRQAATDAQRFIKIQSATKSGTANSK